MFVSAFLVWFGLSTASAQDADTPDADDAAEARPEDGDSKKKKKKKDNADAEKPPIDTPLLLGIRGVGEIWQDPALVEAHRSSYFSAAGMASWRFSSLLSADIELSYLRMGADDGAAHEMAPLSIDITARKTLEQMELFAGIGPAIVPFNSVGSSATSGTKLGIDMRAGVRIGTRLYNPPSYPPPAIQRLDVELMIGRRQHIRTPDAIIGLQQALQQRPQIPGQGDGHLDLSALRVGIGLVVRR